MELLSPKTLVLIAADGSGGGYSQIPEREKGVVLSWKRGSCIHQALEESFHKGGNTVPRANWFLNPSLAHG